MSDFGRDRSDSASSKDQRDEKSGGLARPESRSMLGAAVAAYGQGAIQRKIAERAAKRNPAPSEGASSGGATLPGPVQAKMEHAFNADFSDVRVHQGAQAEDLGARAYARGSDLHFAPGEYDPASSNGQALIGHELTHVVQQRGGRVATQGKDGPINNDPALEGEADRMGAAAARGERVAVAGSSAGLQRKGADSPIQCDKGTRVETLADQSKGKLGRKTLEETEVVGKDATGADRSSPRGDALAAAISKGAFQATADALAGPSFDTQSNFQAAFIAGWKTLNPGFDDKGAAAGQALLDPILQAKFKGNKLGYLQDLRAHGQSSCEWEVLLCLGEVEGGMAHDDAVVRAFERAAEKLDDASFQLFWAKVEGPLKKNMHHVFTSDRRLKRVLAAKHLKDSEAPVARAEVSLQQAEGRELAADTQKEKTEAAKQKQETVLSAKQKRETRTEEVLHKAKDEKHHAQDKVDSETARVDKRRTAAQESDVELAQAQTKLDADTQALQEANLAHEEALLALEDANRRLKRREERAGQARLAVLPKSDGRAEDEASTPQHTDGAPKDEIEEVRRLEARAERAWQRAMNATRRALEAQAEIEKQEQEVATSKDGFAKAQASQHDAQDSLQRHEAELKARQAKLADAKKNVATADKAAKAAKAKAEEAEKAVKALETKLTADEATLGKAKKDVTTAKGVLADKKKDQLNVGTEVAYLAALVESLASKLNDFDREAIEELHKWATDHQQAVAQAMAPGSPFLAALDKYISKARNKELFKAIIEGKKATDIKQALAGKDKNDKGLGFKEHDAEAALEEVTMTALIVDREAQKHQDKKVQIRVGPAKIEHVVLKQQLMAMSPEAREQYLAFTTNTSKGDLAKEKERGQALLLLDTKLKDKCGVVDDKERERMLALFKVAGAGVNYSKLYGLVHTTASAKYATDDDFAKKALAYVSDFGDGEFHQLRQDTEVLAAIKVCKKKDDINKLVGGLDNGEIKKLDATGGDKARTDALHEPVHWSTLINLEMDKWRVSARDERNRNDVYMFGHHAQQAAIEVAKAKNPADKTAGAPTHADAMKFVTDVWKGVSGTAQTDMKSQYPDLATALEAGGEVTVKMVLDSIAKFHVGSWKFHVDKADLKKVITSARGKELLEQWSNIQVFKDSKKGLDATKERELKRTFVLDVNAEKRQYLDEAVGSESLAIANTLRERFKQAAENDGEFKAGLAEAGYDNSQLNREKMEFRGLLEKASKQRTGWDVGGLSSKGHVQHQAHREFVGGLRSANKDDQEINDKKDGQNDKAVDKSRDEHFEEHHAKSLDEKREELEISGEEFDKLRENIRKYTEIAIAVIISVAISAATMGTVPAWAMVLVKVGAVIMADIIKEVVGNAITGDKLNAQKLVTNIAVDAIGTAAGGFAGMGFEQNAGEMNTFLKEFIKGTVTSVTKSFGKDAVKLAAERNAGEVSVSGAIKNQIVGFVVAAASSQLSALVMEEQGLSKLEGDSKAHDDKIAPDKQSIEHLNGSKPDAQHTIDQDQHAADQAQSTVNGAQHTVDADHSSVSTDQTSFASDTSHLATANEQVAAAQQHLNAMQQQYQAAVQSHAGASTLAADQHQLDQASGQLHAAQANVDHAQHALQADQARLDGDQTRLGTDQATLESDQQALDNANEQLESAKAQLEDLNTQVEALETKIAPDEGIIASDESQATAIETMGKKIDDAADKILDAPADVIMETLGERAARKREKVTPKPEKS